MIKIKKINGKFLVVDVCYDLELRDKLEEITNDKNKCVLHLKSENHFVRILSLFLLKNNKEDYCEFAIIDDKNKFSDGKHYNLFAYTEDSYSFKSVVKRFTMKV